MAKLHLFSCLAIRGQYFQFSGGSLLEDIKKGRAPSKNEIENMLEDYTDGLTCLNSGSQTWS